MYHICADVLSSDEEKETRNELDTQYEDLFSFADTGNLHKVKKALSQINTKSFVSYNSVVYTFLAGIRPLSILTNILQVALFCSFSASE